MPAHQFPRVISLLGRACLRKNVSGASTELNVEMGSPNPWSTADILLSKGRNVISGSMTNERLGELIREHATVVHNDDPGHWRFDYLDHLAIVVTDPSHNRMRIITPVAEVADLNEEIWLLALSANFDRALDARYAISGDYLWSAFIHPLKQLDAAQFLDGLSQTVTLAANFGTSFSSSDLIFGSG